MATFMHGRQVLVAAGGVALVLAVVTLLTTPAFARGDDPAKEAVPFCVSKTGQVRVVRTCRADEVKYLALLHVIFKEDIKENNEHKKYVLEKLEQLNTVNTFTSDQIKKLAEASRRLAGLEKTASRTKQSVERALETRASPAGDRKDGRATE